MIHSPSLPNSGTAISTDGKKQVIAGKPWKNGFFNDNGTFVYPDGSKYIGEYKSGKWNGQGTLIFPNGDKGEIDQDGYLKITGRVKDIFKTSKGKYVAPNPIEMKFSKNKNIGQICIAGMNLIQPIALIVLSENANKENKLNLEEKLIKTLENVNQQIEKHEQIEKIVIDSEKNL